MNNPQTTTDLIARLRCTQADESHGLMLDQAANEIERLRTENIELRRSRDEWADRAMRAQRELTEKLCG